MSEQALEECLAGFHQSSHYTAALLIKEVLGLERGGGAVRRIEQENALFCIPVSVCVQSDQHVFLT